MASASPLERSHAEVDEWKGVTHSTAGGEAGPCGGETMDSDIGRSSSAIGGVYTEVTASTVIDGYDGTPVDGR